MIQDEEEVEQVQDVEDVVANTLQPRNEQSVQVAGCSCLEDPEVHQHAEVIVEECGRP